MSSSNPLAGVFGKSPFSAMQAHMRVVLECVHEIPPLFEKLAEGDEKGVKSVMERIFEREAAADIIKNDGEFKDEALNDPAFRDYWNEFKPDAAATGYDAFKADYARGYRDARAEDALDRDTEWDNDF